MLLHWFGLIPFGVVSNPDYWIKLIPLFNANQLAQRMQGIRQAKVGAKFGTQQKVMMGELECYQRIYQTMNLAA